MVAGILGDVPKSLFDMDIGGICDLCKFSGDDKSIPLTLFDDGLSVNGVSGLCCKCVKTSDHFKNCKSFTLLWIRLRYGANR